MPAHTTLRTVKVLFLVLSAVTASVPVQAWNSVGHRLVAELAWRQLDKKERSAVSGLLKRHPHYKQMLVADVPPNVAKEEWAFLTAAVWPDMIRHAKPGQPQKPSSITKYDLYPHAIGYPFVRPADRDSVSTENFYIATPNAEMVLSNSIANLTNKQASVADRAVSLCWLLHLMGDLHQPLHTATWVRKDKSGWDGLGGNYIVLEPRGTGLHQTDLHSFWDRLAGVDTSYKAISSLADHLASDSVLAGDIRKELTEDKTIESWVQEGYRLAVGFAYAEDRVKFADLDQVISGKVPESEIPKLSEDYIRQAERIAGRRFVLAGQRLSDVLKRTW